MTNNGFSPEQEVVAGDRLAVLVVEPDHEAARKMVESLDEALPSAHLRSVGTLAEALEVIDQNWSDLIIVTHTLPDGSSVDLLSHTRRAVVPVPVIVQVPEFDEQIQQNCEREGAAACVVGAQEPGTTVFPVKMLSAVALQLGSLRRRILRSRIDQSRLYDLMRSSVSRVAHEINNPLSIISGNAQLLVELGRAVELEEDFMRPLADIEEAGNRIAGLLSNLSDLKDMVPRQPL